MAIWLVALLQPAEGAAAKTSREIIAGQYKNAGKVAVDKRDRRAKKVGLAGRTVQFDMRRAKFSAQDLNADGVVDQLDLQRGDRVSVHAKVPSAVKVLHARLQARRVILLEAPVGPVEAPVAPASTSPSTVDGQWRGFDVGSAWHGLPEQDSVRDLREAAELGADTVRVDLRWYWLAPDQEGSYAADRVAHIDRLLEVARSEGLRVVALVAFTPCWASSAPRQAGECDPEYPMYPPQDPRAFGDFIGWAAERWGTRVSAFEIWNEPNHPFPWRGTAGDYVDLVREASTAVDRSAYPNLPVVAGALSGADLVYLQQLLSKGIDRWSDAISIHPYAMSWGGPGAGFLDPILDRAGDMWSFAAGVPAVHALMRANGDRDPIWLTEFGYADCPATPYCVSQDDQGAYLASALRLAATWDYVDVFLLYRLRDWYGSGSDWEQHFGVLNGDWSQKPAARQVSGALASLPG